MPEKDIEEDDNDVLLAFLALIRPY